MSPKEMTTIRLEPELLDAMRQVKDRDGVPIAVQVDFAVREWLDRRGVKVKSDRRSARTPRRS